MHYVNRKGYWSLETSYRDERGRPRKKVVRYFGKAFNPFTDIDWAATLKGDGKWAELEPEVGYRF